MQEKAAQTLLWNRSKTDGWMKSASGFLQSLETELEWIFATGREGKGLL